MGMYLQNTQEREAKSSLAWSKKEGEGHEALHAASPSGQNHTWEKKQIFRGP